MNYELYPPLSIHELGQRQNQEDTIYPKLGKATTDDRLFILCDGMGGHDHGEVASRTICDSMSKYIKDRFTAKDTFTGANFAEVLNAAIDDLDKKDQGGEKKMGTTLTFLFLHGSGYMVAHIGDSRIYLIRPSEHRIVFRSRDHSLMQSLIDVGELTEEEARTAPNKNILTRAIQPNEERRVKADVRQLTDIRDGDYFYMCSDGMLEQMEDSELVNLISDPALTDKEKVRALIEATRDNKDNHSAHLIHVKSVTGATEVSPVIAVSNTESCKRVVPVSEVHTAKSRKLLASVIAVLVVITVAIIGVMTFTDNKTKEVPDKSVVVKTNKVAKKKSKVTVNNSDTVKPSHTSDNKSSGIVPPKADGTTQTEQSEAKTKMKPSKEELQKITQKKINQRAESH